MRILQFLKELRIFNPYGNGFHEEERKLRKKYYHAEYKPSWGGKRIIVMNDGRSWHAGLSDRLRAMTSVYSWCKEHGCDFRIYCINPFNLSDYLVPNQYQWKIDAKDICYNSKYAEPYLLNSHQLPCRWHDLYLRWAVIGNKEIHLYSNTYFREDDFYQCFHELFRPSRMLQDEIDRQRAKLPKHYVVFAFRFLELLGDFKDCVTQPLNDGQREKLIMKCLSKIRDLHEKKYPNVDVLITADSETFVKRAKETFAFVHTIPGKIGHIDYTENKDTAIHLKAFLDMYLISYAEEVVLLSTDKMYDNSGFAKRGAKIGNVNFTVLKF